MGSPSDASPTWDSLMDVNSTVASAKTGSDQGVLCMQEINFIINTVFAGTLCLLGFVGNAVSFFVLGKDKGTPVASFLLRALAFTDSFFLSAWFLHFSLENAFAYYQIVPDFHISWLYVRVYTYPLLFVAQTGTIWLTVLIAASRYIAVCKPYQAAKFCTVPMMAKGVLVTAIFSVLYNLPRFFEVQFVHRSTYNLTTGPEFRPGRTKLGLSRHYQLVYFDILYYIFSFVLPLILLIYLNTRLMLSYRVIQRRRRTMSTRQDNHDNNITLVMIVVIVLFIFCNAPARIVQLVWGYETQPCPGAEFLVVTFSNVLEVFNSSANFTIYCVFRQKFRHILKQAVCRGRGTQSHEETSMKPLNGVSATTHKTKMTACEV